LDLIEELVSCASGSWDFRVGDPSFIGWFITLAYLVLLFWIIKLISNLVSSQTYDRRRLIGFWVIVFLIYLFFGINKQLDFQTFLTATGRCMSKIEGWYRERREFQLNVIMAGLAATAVFMFGFLIYFRTIITRSSLAILGVSCSLVFVVLRAASIHHVDQLFKIEFFNIKAHAIMELSGVVLVFLNVIIMGWSLRHQRSGQR
jgi:hypothetical protein